ncbi:hypothetical protein SAY86_022388 [Trapa natans]|uniref:O-fucosyltransferase family protein n=1 Tax=Trapa natans TaxID=22666 RepID=A0AAN7LNA9_TRANT|nr:hypothetical protein SAY86_022388 [Trapa natans]
MSRAKKKLSYISVPSQMVNSLSSFSIHSFLISPKRTSSKPCNRILPCWPLPASPRSWFLCLFLFGLFGMIRLGYNLNSCATLSQLREFPKAQLGRELRSSSDTQKIATAAGGFSEPEALNGGGGNGRLETKSRGGRWRPPEEENEFWKQPDGMGYRSCLDFSEEYRRETPEIMRDRRKYLMVVAAGGLNQQRNQIVDAAVIARILGAALVVPILQVNLIWGDESEFSDIFDVEQFKRVLLADDVRVVSSLPSKHLRTRPVVDNLTPAHISPDSIRARYLRKLERVGVLLLRGLDSRLSKDLPPDLQKLRCKVAFQALRFAPRVQEIGDRLAERMRSKGPYLALHLRMEKDVWVRTGCLPGLSRKYDRLINLEREKHPELLTARSSMSYHDRKLAGLCPLNAMEVTRLLKALGAPKGARIYWAGGQPLGGREALQPLTREFPNFFSKDDIALPGELEPFASRASVMAAIDFIICEKSDVFMPSHGGNMGHALQGKRAFEGHKKYITPNKRQMLPYFLNSSIPEPEFSRIMTELHRDSMGQPDLKIGKLGRDVTKFPIPHCMCTYINNNNTLTTSHSS